eukprot:1442-Heterococcus_DN1.PRE.2
MLWQPSLILSTRPVQPDCAQNVSATGRGTFTRFRARAFRQTGLHIFTNTARAVLSRERELSISFHHIE